MGQKSKELAFPGSDSVAEFLSIVNSWLAHLPNGRYVRER